MLLIWPHFCFASNISALLMNVLLFSLCTRLQRQFFEVKKHCAFGLREPRLWNNELNTNQSWSCFWICWSSLDCVNVLQRACSFTADLPVICSYVCLINDDCSAVGVLGKIPCLFCTFSRASSDPQAVWFIPGSKMLYTSALQLGVCFGLLQAEVFTQNQRKPSQMWIQILQAHFF